MLTGREKAFAAGADIKEMAAKTFVDVYDEDLFGAPTDAITAHPQADHRRGHRLLPWAAAASWR